MKNRLLLLLPALMLATFAFGQQSIYLPWEFAGGPPCPINDVVLHNGTLYAATDCGLYKRPENGDTWEQQPNTPDSTVVFLAANAGAVVAVFRQIGGYYNAGYSTLYFFSSTDNGASFVKQYHYDYNHWYGTYGYVQAQTSFAGLHALGDSSFALAANYCDHGCHNIHLVSTNNGQDWAPQSLPGYYYQPSNPYVVQGDTFAIFNYDSLNLVATSNLQGLGAIIIPTALRGVAAGLSWANDRIAVAFRDGRYIYTDDLGQHWETESLPFAGVNDFFYYEGYYYWCANSGFYRSPTIGPAVLETLYTRTGPLGLIQKARRGNNGWYLLANGVLLTLPDGSNAALPVPSDGLNGADGVLSSLPGRLMFRNDNGLWWQSPDGNSWSVYENETAYTQQFQDFYVGDTFCLAYTPFTNGPTKVYRSTDGGANWSFSITQYGVDFIKNRHDERVYFSNIFTSDGGVTWDTLPNFYGPSVALGDTLLTSYNEKISFDHGQNWQDLILPTPSSPSGYHYYSYPLAGRTLYAYPSSGLPVYRSTDFGTTWETIGMGGSSGEFIGPGVSHLVGQTTYLHDAHTLVLLPASGQGYFIVANTPFEEVRFLPGRFYAIKNFGRFVQKDSTVYAARKRGVWRISDCYTEHPFPVPPRDTAICQGNAVIFHGDTLRTAGTYVQRIPGLTTLCDSMDVLRVQVNLIKTDWYKRICTNDTLFWNGQAYTGDSVFTQQLVNATGCDSIVTLHLSTYEGWSSASYTLCIGDTLQLNGQTISAPGQYTFHLTSFLGCDSTLMATVYAGPDTLEYAPTICIGDSYTLFGHTYTEAGDYLFSRTFPSNPCPVFYHILLNVKPDEVIALDTFVTVGTIIYGHIINSDTTFTVLVAGPNSCDKITTITVHTTVGIDNLNTEQAVQAFPNPFRDQLNLRWPGSASAQVRLYDARGQLWREAQLAGPTAVWNTEDLPSGLYRVEIVFAGRHYAWKMVKMP